jgi:hypothetical protein
MTNATSVGIKSDQPSMSGGQPDAGYFGEGTLTRAVIAPAYTLVARVAALGHGSSDSFHEPIGSRHCE